MANIKGKAVIELTDVKTGKKEIINHNNMITNALEKIIPKWALGATNNNEVFFPLISRALGGIYLFDNTLTENADNIWLPNLSTAKLTGYAGLATSDGNDTKRGDFNQNESGEIENGYKLVWDFGTDDANGEIAAISLTNDIAGFLGYYYNPRYAGYYARTKNGNDVAANNYRGCGRESNPLTVPSKSPFFDFVEYKESENVVIRIEKTSSTNIDIETYKFVTNNLDLDTTPYNFTLVKTEHITISDSTMTETSTIVWCDGEDGYYYGFTSNGGLNLKICKINKSNLAYIQGQSYTMPSGVYLCQIRHAHNSSSNYLMVNNVVIRNGYLYTAGYKTAYDNGTLVKIPLNNPTEAAFVEGTTHHIEYYGSTIYGMEMVYKDKNNNIITNSAIVGNNDEVEENKNIWGIGTANSNYNTGSYIKALGSFYYGLTAGTSLNDQNIIGGMPNLQYLATINNLESPVVKTAAKTMKITYTLTYAQ